MFCSVGGGSWPKAESTADGPRPSLTGEDLSPGWLCPGNYFGITTVTLHVVWTSAEAVEAVWRRLIRHIENFHAGSVRRRLRRLARRPARDPRRVGRASRTPTCALLCCAHLPPDSRFRFARTRFSTGSIAAFVAASTLLPFATARAPAVRAAMEASAFSCTIFADSAVPAAPPAANFIRRMATTDWTSRLNFTASIQDLRATSAHLLCCTAGSNRSPGFSFQSRWRRPDRVRATPKCRAFFQHSAGMCVG
jgi:hypothetical protein